MDLIVPVPEFSYLLYSIFKTSKVGSHYENMPIQIY